MFVIDESSYRIDKTSFPTSEEAEQRAAEAARIVGRAINVYELQEGNLNFAFRVMPDGTVEKDNPLSDPESGDQIEPATPVALGEAIAEFDQIAEDLENKGDIAAANRITAAVQQLVDHKNDGKLRQGVKQVKGARSFAQIWFGETLSAMNNVSRVLVEEGMPAYSAEIDKLITKVEALRRKAEAWAKKKK